MATKGGDFAEGILGEITYAIPELFGFEPPAAQQRFRAEHPYASFGASMLTTAVPYVGWYKASKNIKRFDALVEGIGDLNRNPFTTGAVRTMSRFAPLEAARLGVNATVGDMPNSEMLSSALTNELAAGALGGGGEWLLSGGRRAKKIASYGQFDETKPTQLQLRALDDHMATQQVEPDILLQLQNHRSKLRMLARAEELDPVHANYLGPLESGDRQELGRLFNSVDGKSKTILRKRFVDSKRDFADEASWRSAAGRAGLPEDFEKIVQYPRYVAFKGEGAKQSSSSIQKTVQNNMTSIGDNWYIAREANEGMFVMARKIAGQDGHALPTDEWVVLKTDMPDQVATKAGRWANSTIARDAWAAEQKATAGDLGAIGNRIKEFDANSPIENYAIMAENRGAGGKLIDRLKKISGVGEGSTELEALARVKNFHRDYIQPGMFQFRDSPIAAKIMTLVRSSADHAESLTDQIVHGAYRSPKSGSNLLNESFKGATSLNKKNALREYTHEKLSDKDLVVFNNLWKNEATPAQVMEAFAKGDLSQDGLDFINRLIKLNEDTIVDYNKVADALHKPELKARVGHFGISRQWEGDQMIALRDDGGVLHDLASGFNNRDAQNNAQLLLKRNPKLHIAETFDRSSVGGLPKDLQKAIGNPSFVRERHKIGGYRFDVKPWTKDELIQVLEDNIRYRNKAQAEYVAREIIKDDLMRLSRSDPDMANTVATRVNDVFGVQRPLGLWMNKTTDKLLGPMLGGNSASRIASTSNSLLWHFDLGGLRLGYVATQILSPIQTVLPEIAFVLSGTPRRLAPYYDHFAVAGEKGPTGIVSSLSPMKIGLQAMRSMRKPEESLWKVFERAVNERVVGPRITEEFIGESSQKVRDLRTAFSSGDGFVGWLRAVSEFMPAQAERFSRAYSLTVGHDVGKKFFGLEGDKLYQFAKQFTQKTNYLYAAADRPGLFTTPGGTVFGQFKNWMMHYMYSMAEYTGEGFSRGNWSPLLWQQTGTWAVGGLAASPLLNVAGAFNNGFSDKSLLENTYDTFGTNAADGIFYGLPSLLAGVSLSSQTTTPFTNPARDAEMLYSFVLQDRMSALAKAGAAGIDAWSATGEHPAKNDKFRDLLIRALAPKTIYRTMQSFQDENIRSSSTGYPQIKDVGMFDRMLFASGIPADTIERNYAINDILWREKEAKKQMVSSLGEAYYEAMLKRDHPMMKMLLVKAQLSGIASSVLASAKTRQSNSEEDSVERNFGADALIRFNKILGN